MLLPPTYNPTATTFISNTHFTPPAPPSYVGTNQPIFFSSANYTRRPRAPFNYALSFSACHAIW